MKGSRLVLGPAMRADLILDMAGEPGERFTVVDSFYDGLAYRLIDIAYDAAPLRSRPPETPIALAANTMPEPDIAPAERHACHSLEPGVHLTGPSLADLWGTTAGETDGFMRYSQGLKSADFAWDDITLNAWLTDSRSMVPETSRIV